MNILNTFVSDSGTIITTNATTVTKHVINLIKALFADFSRITGTYSQRHIIDKNGVCIGSLTLENTIKIYICKGQSLTMPSYDKAVYLLNDSPFY